VLVFQHLQAIFARHEGQQLDGAQRRELWDARAQPIFALTGEPGLAKRLQLQATAGRPLTICFGNRSRQIPLLHTVSYQAGDGCGLVYPDSANPHAPRFPAYCPTCRQRLTHLKRKATADAIAASRGRHTVLIYNPDGQPTQAWAGTCSRCPSEYLTTNPRIRRCEKCRKNHR
jgi:hypothetical protein